jgi:hypothetical protein
LDANENINVLFNYWDMPGTQFVFVKIVDLPNYSRTKETVRDQAQDEGMIWLAPVKKFQNIDTDLIMGKIPDKPNFCGKKIQGQFSKKRDRKSQGVGSSDQENRNLEGKSQEMSLFLDLDPCETCVGSNADQRLVVCEECKDRTICLTCLKVKFSPKEDWFCRRCVSIGGKFNPEKFTKA